MRKLIAGLLLAVVMISAIGCSCAVEKQSVLRVQAAQTSVNGRYLRYVDADPVLDQKQKEDEHKRIDELNKLVTAVLNLLK